MPRQSPVVLILTTFNYKTILEGTAFPIIPLTICHRDQQADTTALVDSGATISIFRPEVAEQLGLQIEGGQETYLSGVGGRIKGYIHQLKMEAADKKFTCPIVFSYEFTVSFNLLGRDSFFENFVITFDEKNAKLHLE